MEEIVFCQIFSSEIEEESKSRLQRNGPNYPEGVGRDCHPKLKLLVFCFENLCSQSLHAVNDVHRFVWRKVFAFFQMIFARGHFYSAWSIDSKFVVQISQFFVSII